jgi:hypothetical protein
LAPETAGTYLFHILLAFGTPLASTGAAEDGLHKKVQSWFVRFIDLFDVEKHQSFQGFVGDK